MRVAAWLSADRSSRDVWQRVRRRKGRGGSLSPGPFVVPLAVWP